MTNTSTSPDVRSSLSEAADILSAELGLQNRQWAIVGGYVRDALLEERFDKPIISSDIDIVVLGDCPNFSSNRSILKKKRNTFGGMKISTSRFSEIDIWSVQKSSAASVEQFWEEYLSRQDFTINAVMYVYQSSELLIHDDWYEGLSKGIIQEMPYAQKPELQAIRALALASKLSLQTEQTFSLSQSIIEKLYESSISTFNKDIVKNYLNMKCSSRKWNRHLITEYYTTNKFKISQSNFF